MALCFPTVAYKWDSQLGCFKFENGSEIWLLGLDEKERVEKVLGLEFVTVFFNECSQILWPSAEIALNRLAQVVEGLTQRAYYDLNPTTTMHWTYRLFIDKKRPDGRRPVSKPDNYQTMKINPEDNRANLTKEYLEELQDASERNRKRFYEGEYVPSLDGALWTLERIEASRDEEINPDTPEGQERMKALNITRIVLGVDPSGTSGEEDERSGDIGIVVAGRQPGREGRGFILEDSTCNEHPEQWGKRCARLVDKWGVDCVVVEKNFGGEMARHVLKTGGVSCRIKDVTASRGKHIRAEPPAALYEANRISHCGRFDELEEELCLFATDGYKGPRSPNRADAEIWALTELFGKTILGNDTKIISGGRPFFARPENRLDL